MKTGNKIVAKFVRDSRKKLGLTQAELARLLGVKTVHITKYENSYTNAPGDLILRLQKLVEKVTVG